MSDDADSDVSDTVPWTPLPPQLRQEYSPTLTVADMMVWNDYTDSDDSDWDSE